MDKMVKLVKTPVPSISALCAFQKGKYFACQMYPVDWTGSRVPKNTKEGRVIWAEFMADMDAALVKSDDPRSDNGVEWHHIHGTYGYKETYGSNMVWVSILIERGWKVVGNPNKELVY